MLLKRMKLIALSNSTATRLANAFLLLVALSFTSTTGGAGAWRISRPTFRMLRRKNSLTSAAPSSSIRIFSNPRIVRSKLRYRYREDREEEEGDGALLNKVEQFSPLERSWNYTTLVKDPSNNKSTTASRRWKRRQRLLRFVPVLRKRILRRIASEEASANSHEKDILPALQNSTLVTEVTMTLEEMESFQESLSQMEQELEFNPAMTEELTAAMDQEVIPSTRNDEEEGQEEEEEEDEMDFKDESIISTGTEPPTVVSNVHELRAAVLDHKIPLKEVKFNVDYLKPKTRKKPSTYLKESIQKNQSTNMKPSSTKAKSKTAQMLPHPVLKLIETRVKTNSKPGKRCKSDTNHLALSIEGGGMRGAVSAGMASAIAVLGLADAFDSVYGSSAGSVVGSYFVSRQMCIDVYTEILTVAKAKFVSKARLLSSLATNLMDSAVSVPDPLFSKYSRRNPAMNISYVLDEIMCEEGLRPLDMELFRANDQLQPLRVVSSTVRNGKMETHCFGSKDFDYFHVDCQYGGGRIQNATTMVDGKRDGFFACLQTSMTVPAATGPPVPLIRNKDAKENTTSFCFDAFCYEPIPYRSAVKEGATHVLVLKTRPDGDPITTKPGLFEKVFAPMYFDDNDLPEVSDYFERGGQQYIYAEDYLTLDEGRDAGDEGVLVPPPKILYGVDLDQEAQDLITSRSKWKRAHLLPVAVPEGTQQLSTLSVDRGEIVQAVREGFATAFDMLAPITGIELDEHLDGTRIASLLFPDEAIIKNVLENPMKAAGNMIESDDLEEIVSIEEWRGGAFEEEEIQVNTRSSPDGELCTKEDAKQLLHKLPGFQSGRMSALSQGLKLYLR